MIWKESSMASAFRLSASPGEIEGHAPRPGDHQLLLGEEPQVGLFDTSTRKHGRSFPVWAPWLCSLHYLEPPPCTVAAFCAKNHQFSNQQSEELGNSSPFRLCDTFDLGFQAGLWHAEASPPCGFCLKRIGGLPGSFTFGRCKFPTKTIWWIILLRFHGSFPLKWKTMENRSVKSKPWG